MRFSTALIPSVFLLLTIPVTTLAGDSLNIAAGESYTVTAAGQRLVLDKLSIGNGAKIRFADGVALWQVRADHARIGENVLIDASGKAGVDGAAGAGYGQAAAECESGRDGGNGGDGSRGGDAVSVRLQLGLESLGSLRIVSQGGAGGSGGAGGNGQPAGEFSSVCKNAPNGGAAGNGGNGSDGGKAGDISVQYWPANRAVDMAKVPDQIRVDAQPGAMGSAGAAGKPGKGSEGRYIKKRTLSGDRAYIGGGETGAKGADGNAGQIGLAGSVLVEQALVSVTTPPSSAAKTEPAKKPATSKDEEIREIKATLKALMERLDQLEE